MRPWTVLYDTMRSVLHRRIGPREAERLLAGRPADSDHARLARLLAAAAAAPTLDEWDGEGAIEAAFVRAHRLGPVQPAPVRRRRAFTVSLNRIAAVKATAAVAVLVAGGTATAAGTGRLPDRIQQRAHELFSPLGVPAPHTSGTRAAGGAHASGRPTSPTSRPPAQAPGAETVELCRAWDAAQNDPHGKAFPADKLKPLAKAAGGAASIPAYCAQVLATAASPATTTTQAPSAGATPPDSHQGNGDGNGDGKGKGGGHSPPNPHP
jgi:hypothetical protein